MPTQSDQHEPVQRSPSDHNTSQQISPQPLFHQPSARQPPPGMLACIYQILYPNQHDEPRRNHPITSPPRPSISYPIVPPDNNPVDQFENPRPAPLPPTLSRPHLSPATISAPIPSPPTPSPSTPPPPYSPTPDRALINSHTSNAAHSYAYAHARAPAIRRPLSVPPPPREFSSPFATDFPDACHWCSPRQSLQLGRFVLCSACHRVRHCAIGLGAGRVVCNECFRVHFLDGKE
ncbi:hypothetical protein KVR01_010328 [Diaporthe batatas]|uniref:uncharacterized protein n=1 Tax=Diaporthe batatas TaxID=748121 RepID=UPI001D055FE3|nr:uncharacterized protein KVR01_010328 [Diaporthe batatas]KAG8159691.1 hypothetical protein KVR01_010328 [Diaporthe batatas]